MTILKSIRTIGKIGFLVGGKKGNLGGGSGLTLNGRLIKGKGDIVTNDIHKNDIEFVGGYLLLNAVDFEEAVEIMEDIPYLRI